MIAAWQMLIFAAGIRYSIRVIFSSQPIHNSHFVVVQPAVMGAAVFFSVHFRLDWNTYESISTFERTTS
jgi:hypothetical protein